MDHDIVVYIEEQYSEGSLSSSLVIPHSLLNSPTESFACCEIICPWVMSGCYNSGEQAIEFLKSHSIFILWLYLFLSSLYVPNNKYLPLQYALSASSYWTFHLHFSHILIFFIFFKLNPCFLANSELITNSIALLSNNASIITLSCVSILSNPIFTITSLSYQDHKKGT